MGLSRVYLWGRLDNCAINASTTHVCKALTSKITTRTSDHKWQCKNPCTACTLALLCGTRRSRAAPYRSIALSSPFAINRHWIATTTSRCKIELSDHLASHKFEIKLPYFCLLHKRLVRVIHPEVCLFCMIRAYFLIYSRSSRAWPSANCRGAPCIKQCDECFIFESKNRGAQCGDLHGKLCEHTLQAIAAYVLAEMEIRRECGPTVSTTTN